MYKIPPKDTQNNEAIRLEPMDTLCMECPLMNAEDFLITDGILKMLPKIVTRTNNSKIKMETLLWR